MSIKILFVFGSLILSSALGWTAGDTAADLGRGTQGGATQAAVKKTGFCNCPDDSPPSSRNAVGGYQVNDIVTTGPSLTDTTAPVVPTPAGAADADKL